MRSYVADLHIHSCLSPCGSLRMSPQAIVDAAVDRGIDVIALTDHNTCEMGPVVAHTAEKAGLAFLYGIEIQTREEVHLLAYFNDADACNALSEEVYAYLPDVRNDPEYFGDQVVVDEQDNIIRTEEKLLLNSITLSLEDVTERVRAHGGLPVPAHIDRGAFSLLGQLGFFPETTVYPIVEVWGATVPNECGQRAILRSSDAHEPEQIGRRTSVLTMERVSVEEILLAAAGVGGRSIRSEES